MKHLWILSILSSISSAQTKPAEQPPTLSVCELLKDAQKYHMKMVQVRGRYQSTMEGVWLVGDGCNGDIWIDGPQQNPRPWQTKVDFKYDEDADVRVRTKAAGFRAEFPKRCLVYTQTGLFETTKSRSDTSAGPNAPTRVLGFGHLAGSSAQLIVKSMDDVAVLPKCPAKP